MGEIMCHITEKVHEEKGKLFPHTHKRAGMALKQEGIINHDVLRDDDNGSTSSDGDIQF
jgi:hypothetical protein